MQDIIFKLLDDNKNVTSYCVVDNRQLIVLSKKSLEKRVFWNEFRNYELRSGKIYRVNNYKDNVLSRLSGKCEKSQHIFSSDNDIGFADLDYFSYGGVCISLQRVFQEGLIYTGDFVLATTDTLSLYNFYNYIKDNTFVYETSPYHLRFRSEINYIKQDIVIPYYLNVDYALSVLDTTYIDDEDILMKYLSYLNVYCKIHNEDIFSSIKE